MRIYIYVLIDPITKKVRYVGKTNNLKKRYRGHLGSAQKKHSYTQRWINKLLNKGVRPIMRVVDEATDETWESRERHWIAALKRQGVKLTNLTEGGEGHHGYSPTKKTIALRSKALKGSKLSAEARANQSKGRLGMKFTAEHREHLRQRKHELYKTEHGKALADQYSKAYGVINDDQVIEVWRLAWEGNIPQRKIAEMYNIPQSSVSEIKYNKRYKHVKRPDR